MENREPELPGIGEGMDEQQLKNIVEGALLAAGRPLKIDDLEGLFRDEEKPDRNALRAALEGLTADYEGRAMELRQVASGFRIQVRESVSDWVSRLWEERPTRYSRALLETLALIAYRQPITRGEIEEVRGVSVSSSIVRTLQERGWIKVVGHRDVPGRPAMFGTTREFLDYFGLKSLDELPTLSEIRDIDSINVELDLDAEGKPADDAEADAHGDGDADGEAAGEDRDEQDAAGEAAEEGASDEDRELPIDASEEDESASAPQAEDAVTADAEQVVEDPDTGESVDERELGSRPVTDPFEESPYESQDEGEDLDFEEVPEEANGEAQEESGQQEDQSETERQAPGSGAEVSEQPRPETAEEEDEQGRGH